MSADCPAGPSLHDHLAVSLTDGMQVVVLGNNLLDKELSESGCNWLVSPSGRREQTGETEYASVLSVLSQQWGQQWNYCHGGIFFFFFNVPSPLYEKRLYFSVCPQQKVNSMNQRAVKSFYPTMACVGVVEIPTRASKGSLSRECFPSMTLHWSAAFWLHGNWERAVWRLLSFLSVWGRSTFLPVGNAVWNSLERFAASSRSAGWRSHGLIPGRQIMAVVAVGPR